MMDSTHSEGITSNKDPKKEITNIEEQGTLPFEEKEVRLGFIRRVYIFLTLMLMVDAGCVAAGICIPTINLFLSSSMVPLILVGVLFIFFYVLMFSVLMFRERLHWGWVAYCTYALLTLTGSAGAVLATVALALAMPSLEDILRATLGSGLVLLSVTLIAVCCPCDFTNFSIVLSTAGLTVSMGVAASLFAFMFVDVCGRLPLVFFILAVSVILFALHLACDTQMILGGKAHQLKRDEHFNGAIRLWADIFFIFLNILHIFISFF